MALRVGGRRAVAEINVTPLVDVVLVLLIIFMVLTPLAEKQMYTRVPEPETAVVPPDQVPPDQVVLTALANGRVLLNRDELSVQDAMASLSGAYRGRPSKVLFFNSEDAVSYEQAVKILDLAHQAGVNTIGMITEAPARSSP